MILFGSDLDSITKTVAFHFRTSSWSFIYNIKMKKALTCIWFNYVFCALQNSWIYLSWEVSNYLSFDNSYGGSFFYGTIGKRVRITSEWTIWNYGSKILNEELKNLNSNRMFILWCIHNGDRIRCEEYNRLDRLYSHIYIGAWTCVVVANFIILFRNFGYRNT